MAKVEFGHAQTLRNEIRWYRDVARRGLPRRLFITSHAGPGLSFLLLKCFGDGSTVDAHALAGASGGKLGHHIASAVDSDTELFHRTQRRAGPAQVHRLVEQRLVRRRRQAFAFPYLRTLIDADIVTINGEPLPGTSRCLSRITGDPRLMSHLTPDRVGMTFGDLHCGNILVDGESTEVVDPRGGPLLPITYDYGKLVQSIEGGYGAVMAGQYVLWSPRSCGPTHAPCGSAAPKTAAR
ncbi:hypothetical protein DN069_36445 [Streptacidiphilus pinicola]|uniref:Aminoglycoside phosphotransferase domain-containing protein n=1 Tax=Streptacidiphilus pinicola TaxID=2219663 RepID=A0A2X0I730_9ACTN|nr:hypothetical protein DN069_36445 [Streptacidiphilus pinicola]